MRTLSILGGGAAGALARAGVAEGLPHGAGQWPWATFSVNLFGAALLAWLTTRLSEMVAPTRYWRLLLGTGFCGALTTFSTFGFETVRLVEEGSLLEAFVNVAASLVAGLVAVAAGWALLAVL